MIAIRTKYISYTDTKPVRIKAYTCNGHNITLSIHNDCFNNCNSAEQFHAVTASILASKNGWYTPANYLIGGSLGEGENVYVFSDSNDIAPKQENNTGA